MRLKKRLIKTGGVIMKLFLLFIFGWPFFLDDFHLLTDDR